MGVCRFRHTRMGFGRSSGTRTRGCLAENQMPYRLAMLPRLVDPPGIEPGPPACKAGMPRDNTSDPKMAERTGFEPVMCA